MENSDQKPTPSVDGPDSDGAYTIEFNLSKEEFERWQAVCDADSDWEAFKAAEIKVREYPEFIWSSLDYIWHNLMRPWLRRRFR